MIDNFEIVNIPENLCIEIERRYFEYEAAKHLIGYLMSRKDTQVELLQMYLDSAELKFADLEMMKNEVISAYPSQNGWANYYVDFINSCLKYTPERVANA